MFKQNCKGMIALMPVLVISGLLLFLCINISISFLSFLGRTKIFEEKIQSEISAYGCISKVLAKIKIDHTYRGGESVAVQDDMCEIWPFEGLNGKVSVKIGEAKTVRIFAVDKI